MEVGGQIDRFPPRRDGLEGRGPRSCKTVGPSRLSASTPHGHGRLGLAYLLGLKPRSKAPLHHDPLRGGYLRSARARDAYAVPLRRAGRRLLACARPLATPQGRPLLPAGGSPVLRPSDRIHALPAGPRALGYNLDPARPGRRLVVAVRGGDRRREAHGLEPHQPSGPPGSGPEADRAVVAHAAPSPGAGGEPGGCRRAPGRDRARPGRRSPGVGQAGGRRSADPSS